MQIINYLYPPPKIKCIFLIIVNCMCQIVLFYKKRLFYLVGSKKSSTFVAFLYCAEYALLVYLGVGEGWRWIL